MKDCLTKIRLENRLKAAGEVPCAETVDNDYEAWQSDSDPDSDLVDIKTLKKRMGKIARTIALGRAERLLPTKGPAILRKMALELDAIRGSFLQLPPDHRARLMKPKYLNIWRGTEGFMNNPEADPMDAVNSISSRLKTAPQAGTSLAQAARENRLKNQVEQLENQKAALENRLNQYINGNIQRLAGIYRSLLLQNMTAEYLDSIVQSRGAEPENQFQIPVPEEEAEFYNPQDVNASPSYVGSPSLAPPGRTSAENQEIFFENLPKKVRSLSPRSNRPVGSPSRRRHSSLAEAERKLQQNYEKLYPSTKGKEKRLSASPSPIVDFPSEAVSPVRKALLEQRQNEEETARQLEEILMGFSNELECTVWDLNYLFSKNNEFFITDRVRDYEWEHTEVTQLFDDLLEKMRLNSKNSEDESRYFLGVIILCRRPEYVRPEQFEVIDGHQRLVTLLLLISSIRQHLKRANESDKDFVPYLENVLKQPPGFLVVGHDRLRAKPSMEEYFRSNVLDGIFTSFWPAVDKRPCVRLKHNSWDLNKRLRNMSVDEVQNLATFLFCNVNVAVLIAKENSVKTILKLKERALESSP